MTKNIVTLAAVAALSSFAGTAHAGVLASDAFNYTGALTANGWTAHSGAGNKVIMANGSYARLEQSAFSGEDVGITFPAQSATSKTYAGFDILVETADLSLLDANGLYAAHMKDAGFGFRARTGVVVPAAGGDFGLAINANSSALGAGSAWPLDLTFDTWYRVVISFDAATGTAELWLNPTVSTDPSISDGSTSTGNLIDRFALRQSNDYTGFIQIDNVVAGTSFNDVVPAPSTLALLGLGGLAAARRRR